MDEDVFTPECRVLDAVNRYLRKWTGCTDFSEFFFLGSEVLNDSEGVPPFNLISVMDISNVVVAKKGDSGVMLVEFIFKKTCKQVTISLEISKPRIFLEVLWVSYETASPVFSRPVHQEHGKLPIREEPGLASIAEDHVEEIAPIFAQCK